MATGQRSAMSFHASAIRLSIATLSLVSAAWGQHMLRPNIQDGSIRIINSDRAVLSSPETRTDVPCTVLPSKPKLGFDRILDDTLAYQRAQVI